MRVTRNQAACTLNLSVPPSINRRVAKLGNRSPEVKAWVRDCDSRPLVERYRPPRFTEEVAIEITWDERQLGDLDNRVKPLLELHAAH
jgi:hypothetical protein